MQYPVSAHVTADGFESTGLSHNDYSRMQTIHKSQVRERRLPTPEWATNYALQRELLAAYLLNRAKHGGDMQRQIIALRVVPVNIRVAMAQAMLASRCPSLIEQVTRHCHEYVHLKRENPKHPRLRQLEMLIEGIDTRLCHELKDGTLGLVARIVQLYYSCGMDSVGVATELGIKPPMVRKTLFQLHRVWAMLNGNREQDLAETNARNAAWQHKSILRGDTPRLKTVREPRAPREQKQRQYKPRAEAPERQSARSRRIENMAALRATGMTFAEIGKQHGVSWQRVQEILTPRHRVRNRRPLSGEDIVLGVRFSAGVRRTKALAEQMNVSTDTIRERLKRLGVAPKPGNPIKENPKPKSLYMRQYRAANPGAGRQKQTTA